MMCNDLQRFSVEFGFVATGDKTKLDRKSLQIVIYLSLELFEDYYHPSLVYKATNRPMQFDIFLPSLQLAFEYQGIQHYQDLYYFGTSVAVSETFRTFLL